MPFTKRKTDFLSKKDKSRKGSIDGKIKNLVSRINSFDDFYTTSSCSGRILLLAIPKSNKKNEVKYLFCSHEKIRNNEFKKLIKTMKSKKLPKEDVWFRVEPAILHVACNSIENAGKLLDIARDIGFRRSGIISIGKNRAVLELISTEKIDALVSKKGKLLIDENYLKVLVKEGNEKLEKTWGKIGRLYDKLDNIKGTAIDKTIDKSAINKKQL